MEHIFAPDSKACPTFFTKSLTHHHITSCLCLITPSKLIAVVTVIVTATLV